MKKKLIISLLLSFAFLLVPVGADEKKDQPLGALLRDALFAEAADRDLAKAEAGYREIIERFDEERAYAATALLRLAEMLEERGEKVEAEKLFARIVQEFPDQEPVAKVARVRLGEKVPSANPRGNPSSTLAEIPELRELARLKKLLAESPDLLDAAGSGGVTPLADAASKGYSKVVEFLLENGANINGAGHSSAPLLKAAMSGHLTITKRLQSAGAKIEDSFLPHIVKTGNYAISKLLLEAGADPNHMYRLNLKDPNADPTRRPPTDPSHRTGVLHSSFSPLDVAMFYQYASLTKLLIDHGAKPLKDDWGNSHEIRFATIADDGKAVADFLKKGADPNAKWYGQSLLHIAAKNGHGEIAKQLIEAGAKVDAFTQTGNTPLHEATGSVIGVLVAAGADVNASNHDGQRPLHDIWEPEDVRLLLAEGASIDARNGKNLTPVEFAAAQNHTLLNVYLEVPGRVDLTSSGPNGTLLGYAARFENIESIKLLVAAGADPNLADPRGQTPLHRAVASRNPESVRALLDAGADPEGNGSALTPLTALPDEGSTSSWLNALRLLVDGGADPNAIDGSGKTALAKAAARGDRAAVTYLLEKGASPLAGNKPAFEHPISGNSAGRAAIRRQLFLAAYLDPEVRKGVLRFGYPEGGNLWATIGPLAGDGVGLPECSHSLIEAYGYLLGRQPAVGNINIWRAGQADPIVKDLRAMIEKRDTNPDFQLEWGDVVEFESSIGAESGISEEGKDFLKEYLQRKVTVIHGEDPPQEILLTADNWYLSKQYRRWTVSKNGRVDFAEAGSKNVNRLLPLQRIVLSAFSRRYPAQWKITREIDGSPLSVEVPNEPDAHHIWLEDGDQIQLSPEKLPEDEVEPPAQESPFSSGDD